MTNSIEWCYGWNQPGYMPDASDAAESWDAARDSLIWELDRLDCDESTCTDADLDHAIALLQGATPERPIDVRAGRWVYFIIDSDVEHV